MKKISKYLIGFHVLDLIPAIAGLIGKIALVSSFALMWSQELNISYPDFVYYNVRIEILIGSALTILFALIYKNISPSGTLAPLIVLIPSMVVFGVHPFVLGVLVSLIGALALKTKFFDKLTDLSGPICRNSLTLVFGISGIIMSIKKLIIYFDKNVILLVVLFSVLTLLFLFLNHYKINYLIVPAAAVLSIFIPYIFGYLPDLSINSKPLSFSPSHWWNNVWGVGFGFTFINILKALPFSVFVVLLWTMDLTSVNTVINSNYKSGETKHDFDENLSFYAASLRNLAGVTFGGAQTASIWRSFLIPLYIVKRPMRYASLLLGTLGLISSITQVPLRLFSYSPIIWTVLLYGVFLPFVIAGFRNITKSDDKRFKFSNIIFTFIGIIISPVLTWIISVITEKLFIFHDKKTSIKANNKSK